MRERERINERIELKKKEGEYEKLNGYYWFFINKL